MGGGYQDSNGNWLNFQNRDAITATRTVIVAYRPYDGINNQPGHKVNCSLLPAGSGIEITSEPTAGDIYRYVETILVALTFSDNTWRGFAYQYRRDLAKAREIIAFLREQAQDSGLPWRMGTQRVTTRMPWTSFGMGLDEWGNAHAEAQE